MTAEEINRRVAEALGWAWVYMKKRGSRHAPRPSFVRLESINPIFEWELWTGTREEAEAGYRKTWGNPYCAVPDYCHHFNACALLKAHLQGISWEWRTGWDRKRGHWAEVEPPTGAFSPAFVTPYSGDTEGAALCLAFLEADAAQKEAVNG